MKYSKLVLFAVALSLTACSRQAAIESERKARIEAEERARDQAVQAAKRADEANKSQQGSSSATESESKK